jgi:CheY-like chemotaxis protein
MISFEQRMAQMRSDYLKTLPDALREMDGLHKDALSSAEAFEKLRLRIHSLAGSGATYGQQAITDAARKAEECMDSLQHQDGTHIPIDAYFDLLVENLRLTLKLALTNADDDTPVYAPQHPDQSHNQTTRPEAKSNDRSHDSVWGHSSLTIKAPNAVERKPLILVVDDDDMILKSLSSALYDEGYKVVTAVDGHSAFSVTLHEKPDLIITDYNMPNGAGNYLLGRLKSNKETSNIPVIILTGQKLAGGKDNYGLKRDLMGQCGADAFLYKPLDFKAIFREVERRL